NLVYLIPVGKNQKMLNTSGPLDWVLGGWQLSTIFVVETGQPYSPVMGSQNLSGALSGNWLTIPVLTIRMPALAQPPRVSLRQPQSAGVWSNLASGYRSDPPSGRPTAL